MVKVTHLKRIPECQLTRRGGNKNKRTTRKRRIQRKKLNIQEKVKNKNVYLFVSQRSYISQNIFDNY